MERLKAKDGNLANSLGDDYVDDSKGILDEILKYNDYKVPSDDDEVVEYAETEKDRKLKNKVRICHFVYIGKGNERKE